MLKAIMLSKLPLELQRKILSYLSVQHLKNARLVCRDLDTAGSSFLFTRTSILARLAEIAFSQKPFAIGVKTIRFGYFSLPQSAPTTQQEFGDILYMIEAEDIVVLHRGYQALFADQKQIIEQNLTRIKSPEHSSASKILRILSLALTEPWAQNKFAGRIRTDERVGTCSQCPSQIKLPLQALFYGV
jgi:hypothetical protein